MWDLNKMIEEKCGNKNDKDGINQLICKTFGNKEDKDGSRIEELIGNFDDIIISGEASGKIRVWDIYNNIKSKYEKPSDSCDSKELNPLNCLTAALINNDIKLVAGYMDKKIRIWSLEKDDYFELIDEQINAPMKSLVYSSKDDILICGSLDGDIIVFDFSEPFKRLHFIPSSKEKKIENDEEDKEKEKEEKKNEKSTKNNKNKNIEKKEKKIEKPTKNNKNNNINQINQKKQKNQDNIPKTSKEILRIPVVFKENADINKKHANAILAWI